MWLTVFPKGEASETDPESQLSEFVEALPISDVRLGPTRIVRVDERRALQVDITGLDSSSNLAIEGTILVTSWFDQTGFVIGVAGADQWSSFAPTFEAVVESVDVFNPPGVRFAE
jgi:hypothetical protein